MQGRTGFALRPAIAALTIGASAFALAPTSEAAPAESCLKAPHGVAPQGSHWYYRIERSSQRRCWYLGDKGRGTAQRTATRAAPQAEQDQNEESDSPAAPVANTPVVNAPAATAPAAPVASVPTAPLANASPPADQPKPAITMLTTRNVSNTEQIAQVAPTQDASQQPAAPNSQPGTTAEAAPAPVVQAPSDQPPATAAEQPAPPPAAAPAQTASPSAQTMPTLQLLLGALALLGLLTSATLFMMAMVRRRKDVLNVRREPHTLPYEASPETSAEDRPTFQSMPALDPIRQHDDVDEALRRMTRRRRAAATS
jgi:hypothetical protein